MGKILSIIVPSYNMEGYLGKCLSSLEVAPELMRCLEVVVVNDGSKDSTSKIAHEFEQKCASVFVVVDKANGHYGSCVNSAVPIASGKYVKIVDADDYVDPNGLRVLLEELGRIDDDLVIMDYDIVDACNQVTRKVRYDIPRSQTVSLDVVPSRIEIQSLAYKTDVLKAVGYRQTEGISYTDLEWITYPMAGVRTVRYIPVVVTKYLVGRDGQTVTPSTYARNGEMLLTINRRFVDYYCRGMRECVNDTSRRYVGNLIKRHVQNVYAARIIMFGYRVAGSLAQYDDWLKAKSPELYAAMDGVIASSRRFQFHYIKEWRRRKTRLTYKFMLFWLYVHSVSLVQAIRRHG